MSTNLRDELFDAVISLKTREECDSFFRDLCTEREVSDLSARLRVAMLLDSGVNYNDIAAVTGASTATISRVSKCLSGDVGGYRAVIAKLADPAGMDGTLPDCLTDREVREIALRELFASHGYTPCEVSPCIEYEKMLKYPECRDSSTYLVFQDSDGGIFAIAPTALPVILEMAEEGNERISYAFSSVRRAPSGIKPCHEVGVLHSSPSPDEAAELVSLAAELLKGESRNARLSVFSTCFLAKLFDIENIADETRADLLLAIDVRSEKRIAEMQDLLPKRVFIIANELLRLPTGVDDALLRLDELFPEGEFILARKQLKDAIATVDRKHIRIEPNQSLTGEGLVFSSHKHGIFGREYKNGAIGFKVITE